MKISRYVIAKDKEQALKYFKEDDFNASFTDSLKAVVWLKLWIAPKYGAKIFPVTQTIEVGEPI